MRKSFTLLFSTLILLCVFGFSSFAAAPQLSWTKPADEATNVKPTTTHLVVKFNQNVKFTSTGGTLTVWKLGTGDPVPVKTVALIAGNANAVIAADSLKVKHNLTLTDGTAYSVTITNNAIENAAGEKFAGIAAGGWDFTTGDYTAPVVEKLTPLDGAANVNVKANPFNLVIEFKDALNNIEAVAGKKVWIYEADGTIVDIIVIDGTNTSVSGKIATVKVNTNAFVNELTEYYVNVEAGAFTDTSPNKNKFAGIMNKTTWNFSSRDYSAAYLTAATVTNVSYATATLNATANEAGLIWYKRQLATDAAPTGTATEAGGWTKVTTGTGNSITAALSGMTDGTKYAVYVVAENAQAQQQTVATKIEFTTLDNTAPLASDKTVVNENNKTVGVKLTFNEEIIAGTGNLLIKKQSNNETVRTVPASELLIEKGLLTNLGKWFMTARFEELESGVGYYVVIPSGYVEDVAGNDYVSTFVTATAWQFTSSDFVVPTVVVKIAASTPPAAADNIVIDFSEEVRLMNGVAMSTLNTDADWFNYIALEKANVPVPFTASYAGSVITINPNADLAPNSTYVVKIRKNTFEDLNDNAFSAEHKTYELVTGDFGAATITYAPLNNATAVAKGTQPKITFSKVAKVKGTTAADITPANLKPLLVFKKDNASGANVAFTVSWDAATRTATLVPDAELASEGVYYVDIDHTKVEDVYAGAFADPGTSLFTMVDYIVPTVTFSHTGTVTNKAAADPLVLTFSEDVNLLFDPPSDLVVFKQDNANGANLAFSAAWDAATDKLTITPSAPLEKGKVYYYGVGAGVASDGVNKNAAALTTFTFEPAVPDQLEVAEDGYVPAVKATGVKVNTAGDLVATLTFTEAVKANPTMPTAHDAKLFIKGNATPFSTVAIAAGDFVGSKLTVTFAGITLVSEGEYYITIDPNVVVANANNSKTFPGIAADKWTFTAADIVKPVLTANAPANLATGVALNAPVIIGAAAEDVVTGTGNITIAGTGDSKTIAVTNTVIDNTAGTITVPHAALTQYGTVYTVTVPAGAYKDAAGNENVELTWTFTTVVNPPPTVASLDPADGEDLVAAGTENFVIEFSEEVQKGASGTVAFLFEKGTGATRAVLNGDGTATPNSDTQVGALLVTSANVQVAGNVVTLNFDGYKLVAGKEYFILVESGMFKDKSAPTTANFAGITSYVEDAGGWNFYTKDVVAPTWEVSYTERGEGMDITSDIVITFSKPIEKTGGAEITNADVATLFTLTVNGNAVAFTGNINADKTVVVLENASFLPVLTQANSGHAVAVAPTTGIRGKVNQKAVSTIAETFNISDYVAPTVTVIANEVDVEGNKFKVVLSSTEAGTLYWLVAEGAATTKTAADVMAGTAIADYASGTKTVTVETGIKSETKYTVYAVAVDETGNVSTVKTVTVETDDITKPLLVAKTNTFTNAGVLQLDFNEEVVPGTATAVIRLAGTLEIVDIVPLTATAELDSLILTSTVALTYADDQKFVIEIAGGSGKVADAAGNTWNGQIGLGENAWVVGLNDRTKPTLVSIKPALPETDPKAVIPVNSNIELTFSENVKKATNAQFIIYHWDGALVVYEVLEGNSIAISGKVITLNPSRDWVSGQRYQLTITDGSILDMTGNALAGSIVRQFDAADNVAPTATFLPANNATAVPVGATPTITFSEALVLADGTAIDNFDLETMVYLKKDGAAVAHSAIIDAAKKVITITPTAALTKGAVYTYGFTAGFTDAAKNAVAAKEASFTVATDAVIAAYIEFDPDNNDELNPTVVPVDQAFRIIFNGQLYTYSTVNSENNIAVTPAYLHGATAGAGAITLTHTQTVGEVVTVTNVPFTASIESWTADETVIVITPNAVLGSEKEYDLTVVGNKLQLGVGNQTILTAGETNDYLTEDSLAPTVVNLVPADGTAASASGTLSISFSEKVMAGTGAIQIKHEHGEVVLTIDADSLDIVNNLVKITALSELVEGEEYFVIIPSGVITDLSGNAFAGINGEDDWNFIISETLGAPQIVNVAPLGGNAPVNSSLVITFDRPVKLSAIEGYVAIYNANGVAVQLIRYNDANVGTLISFNADRTVATVDINDLAQNTKYQVEVAPGTFVLNADATLKNEGVTRTIWTFTTEVNEPPVLLIRTPADNATDVSLRTVAKMGFNLEVKAGTGVITLRRGVDGTVVHSFDVNSAEVEFNGKTVSFDISSYLEADATDYYIIVPAGAITNASTTPEAFAGLEQTTSWNFTTQDDGVKPELVTWTPDEVELENNKPTFVLEFNEDVKLVGDVNLVVTKVGETTPALELPLTASMFDGNTVTVTYEERISGVLEYSSEYFVTIEGGAIEDLWENVWEDGVTDPTVWTFHTKDVNTAIAQIQGTGTTSPMLNEVVHVTGTVTGISTGEGFWIQDENAAWSGIWVAYGTTASLNIGDGVYVFGSVAEVAEVTTINASSVEMVDAPVVVAPVVVDGPSAAKAEMYESVLVQVDGARANAANSSGVWTIYYEATNMVAVNKWLYTYTPVAGNFYDVAGIVNGRLSDYKLEPRMASDITDLTATNAPVVPVVDFKVYPNPFNDRISIDNYDKLTRVVITNIAGQRVVDVQFPEREIRTANLVSGVYVISLFTEDGMVKSDRIVKR